MNAPVLDGGFADAPRDAAFAFRHLMEAMARPGTIHEVTGATPPEPLSIAAGVTLLTLCDPDTPLWLAPSLENPALRDWITFHTGAPFCTPAEAMFALGAWKELPLDAFSTGRSDYPDRSATLIVEMSELRAEGTRLTGPGIEMEAALNLPETEAFRRNAGLFPRGLDFIFTAGKRLAALPRSTRIG